MNGLSMRARLIALLALVVALVLVATVAAIRTATAEPGVDQLVKLIKTEVLLVEAALADDPERAEPALWSDLEHVGVRLSTAEPVAQREPLLRFADELTLKLAARYGPDRVRLSTTPQMRVWVRAERASRPWIGFEIEPFVGRIRRAAWAIVWVSALAVLFGAIWFARSLTRPLERLARAAPDLVAGLAPPPGDRGLPPELSALAQALERAGRERRAALEAREQALAEVSHDLRTPLARLRFALELGDAADPRHHAAMIADVEELDAIVGEALAWLRDGREEPAAEVDLAALLESVVAAFARHQQGIALDAMPARIRGKPVALKRALSNLLDNALRHGGPPVQVQLLAHDESVRISVRDSGAAHASATDGARYGLGLGIVRAVAAAHRGSVSVRPSTAGCEVILELRGT